MKTEKEIKAIQLQFLEKMRDFNFPKWAQEKNRQYILNLSFSGVSHVAKGLEDLVMVYTGKTLCTPFQSELLKNSLLGAFTCADAINLQAMAIYADFIHYVIPMYLKIESN